MIRMSRIVSILGAVAVMTIMGLTIAVVAYAAQNGNALGTTKVTLCHKDKNTITVGKPAVDAHMNHGDDMGACNSAQARTTSFDETTMMIVPTTVPETTTTVPETTTTVPETTTTVMEEEIGEDAKSADPATDTTNTEGTTQNDNITLGTDSEDDVLYGDSSANKLLGRHGNDYLDGDQGRDRMVGGKQSDYINGADGKPGDVINGGIGIDHCVGDVGDAIKNCDGNVVNVPLPSEAAAPAEARN
jgi:Ca2+-binding RTX toxin-like protein